MNWFFINNFSFIHFFHCKYFSCFLHLDFPYFTKTSFANNILARKTCLRNGLLCCCCLLIIRIVKFNTYILSTLCKRVWNRIFTWRKVISKLKTNYIERLECGLYDLLLKTETDDPLDLLSGNFFKITVFASKKRL